MKFGFLTLAFVFVLTGASFLSFAQSGAAAARYTGKFEGALVANSEDFDRVVFKYAAADERAKSLQSLMSADAHTAAARLTNPLTGEETLSAMLVEERNKNPFLLVDINGDGAISDGEKFAFAREQADNPYLWTATVNLPVESGAFKSCPIFLRYFKEIKIGKMSDDDRLLTQSTEVFARGSVDLDGGKKIKVQYSYDFASGNATPQKGWQGIDADGDGAIDMDKFSPEAAKAAKGETVVFRAGNLYLSTDTADALKNEIVLRARDAKDYKRIELGVGRELPDFEFTDLAGKKRRFSEFRGKYVVLDFWGLWCPACREEVPYLREAYKRYKDRNFEIVGMNTDEFAPAEIKQALDKSEISWTQARLESIFDVMNGGFRIESFPSTLLIAPDGKILSLSRTDRDEPDLRGRDLLDALDKILPKSKPVLKTAADK